MRDPNRRHEGAMATNLALKRAKKAQRRKQVVTDKRTAEALDATLAARVRRAAEKPVQHCLLTQALFENGLGTLTLARGLSPDHVDMATFLLDPFCLGIKGVWFRSLGSEEFAFYLETAGEAAPLAPVDPSYARKLVRDLAVWSQSIGLSPHPDFAVAERMFGEVSAHACDVAFRFGHEGKPFYMPGPTETASQIRRRLEQLRRTLGDDGFDYGIPA